jgi:hypothetical protein
VGRPRLNCWLDNKPENSASGWTKEHQGDNNSRAMVIYIQLRAGDIAAFREEK